MTLDCIAFIEYTTLSVKQAVTAVNRSTIPGIDRGQVRVPISVDRYTRSIILSDILYVLQIKENLISVARLQDKRLVVETTTLPQRKALVIKSQGRKVGVVSRVENSYILDILTESTMSVELVTA
jgi:hypothetical protein